MWCMCVVTLLKGDSDTLHFLLKGAKCGKDSFPESNKNIGWAKEASGSW